MNIDNAVGVCIERALLQIVEIRVQMYSPTRCYKTRYGVISMAQDWRECFGGVAPGYPRNRVAGENSDATSMPGVARNL